MLLQKIRDESLEARRARNTEKASLLVTLYAEAARVGKDAGNRDSTDDEVVKVVRKFIKGLDESLAVLTDETARARALAEKSVLSTFLPTMLAGQELKAAIDAIVAELTEKTPKQMGLVMKALKERYAGAYDGNEASALVKAALA